MGELGALHAEPNSQGCVASLFSEGPPKGYVGVQAIPALEEDSRATVRTCNGLLTAGR